MTAPSIVWVESTTTAGNSTDSLPADGSQATVGAEIGDLVVYVQMGSHATTTTTNAPIYTDNSAACTWATDVKRNSTVASNSFTVIFSRILTSTDFVGGVESGGLRCWTNDTTSWNSASGRAVYLIRHASGWDSSRLVGSTEHHANEANGTTITAYSGSALRPAIAIAAIGLGTSADTQITWDGGSSREPYVNESNGPAGTLGGQSAVNVSGCSYTSGSPTITTANAALSHLGRGVNQAIWSGGYISAVSPGVSVTVSVNAASSGSGQTLVFDPQHYGTNQGRAQSDFALYDSGTTSVTFASSLGVANTTHSFSIAVYETVLASTDGEGDLDVTATLAATGVRTTDSTGSLSGGGQLAATAVKTVNGTADMAITVTLAGSRQGVTQVEGSGSLSGGGTFSATGVRNVAATGAISGGGSFAATAVRQVEGTASASITATLTGEQLVPVEWHDAGGGWSSSSVLRLGGRTITGTASMSISATLAATGTRVNFPNGIGNAAIVATLTATGTRQVEATAHLDGGGELSANSARELSWKIGRPEAKWTIGRPDDKWTVGQPTV